MNFEVKHTPEALTWKTHQDSEWKMENNKLTFTGPDSIEVCQPVTMQGKALNPDVLNHMIMELREKFETAERDDVDEHLLQRTHLQLLIKHVKVFADEQKFRDVYNNLVATHSNDGLEATREVAEDAGAFVKVVQKSPKKYLFIFHQRSQVFACQGCDEEIKLTEIK